MKSGTIFVPGIAQTIALDVPSGTSTKYTLRLAPSPVDLRGATAATDAATGIKLGKWTGDEIRAGIQTDIPNDLSPNDYVVWTSVEKESEVHTHSCPIVMVDRASPEGQNKIFNSVANAAASSMNPAHGLIMRAGFVRMLAVCALVLYW